jgi:hypothetical protein
VAAKIGEFRKMEAQVLAGAKVEESILITAKGNLQRRTGGKNMVSWDGVNLTGALMSHTHPKGGTLGPDDIRKTMFFGMEGVRAHAGSRIYTSKPGPKAKKFEREAEMYADPEYQIAYTEAWAVIGQMQDSYVLDSGKKREEAATHLTWIGLERKGWIHYHVEKGENQ